MTEISALLDIDALKAKCKKIDFCLPANELSIQSDLKELSEVVNFLVNSPLDDAFFTTNKIQHLRSYLLNEFLFFLCKYIIEFKSFINQDNHKYAMQILEQTLVLCLRIIKFNTEGLKPFETLKLILEADRQIYRIKNQYEFNDHQFIPYEISEEQRSFIDKLKVNDFVDALKIDFKINNSAVIAWSRGRIQKLSDSFIIVDWLGDDTSRKILKYSYDIQPFKSKVKDEDWDWRFQLKQMDLIDCPDENVWYNATIINRKIFKTGGVDEEIIEYKVGFRHYDENGPSTDPQMGNRHYFGWSNQYDEEIRATNPRIQKLNTFAKKFCKYASMSNAEESIKDHNDFVYDREDKVVYAVPRQNSKNQRYFSLQFYPNNRKSIQFAKLIQIFGEQGGFDYFYERINDKIKWCPIEQLHYMLLIIGQMHEMLHRKIAQQYAPKLTEAVVYNLMNSPDSNLRNFSTQRIQESLLNLGLIAKRYYSLKEKTEMIDKLDMDLAIKCLKSEFLERKLQGLKSIQELIKKAKEQQVSMYNSDLKYLTIQLVVDWINENRVFESLYRESGSAHLVQRSSEFLKFMLEEKLVNQQQLKMIIDKYKQCEQEEKQAICKVLKDASLQFQKDQLSILITSICDMTPSKEDIELLNDLMRVSYKYKEEFQDKISIFLLAQLSQSQLNPELAELIINSYIDIITSFEMKSQRKNTLTLLSKNIIKDIQTSLNLRVLMKFIDKLDISQTSWDQFTRDVALTFLAKECDIINVILNSIKVHKQKAQVQSNHYIEGLKSRIEFIQYFYANIINADYQLNFDIIVTLWEELVTNGQTQAEKDLIYKWFQEQNNLSVKQEDLKSFFEQKMTQNIEQLSVQGFQCLQNVLLLINNYIGLIEKNLKQPKVVLMELYGYEILQNIILLAQDAKVSQMARNFVLSVIQNYESESFKNLKLYLDYTFDKLKENKSDPQKLTRLLQIIEDLMDESETKGIGSLKSLAALTSSEQVIIQLDNIMITGYQIPKKFTVKMQEGQTVLELRVLISKKIRASYDSINLEGSFIGPILYTWNGKTIRDLRLRRGEVIKITKRQTQPIPEEDLVDKNGNFTPKAQKAFSEIFANFSTNGKMNKEQCAQLVTACTGNSSHQDDPNISRLYEQYDKDKDGLLEEKNFLDFYCDASKNKKPTVWQNLHHLNYRNDLLRGDQVEVEEVDITQLPRYIIFQSKEHMEFLFEMLDISAVSEQAWYLLRRLPPLGISNWDSDASLFRQLYNLNVLMSEEHLPDLINNVEQFLVLFEKTSSLVSMDVYQKELLAVLLKIISNLLLGVLYIHVPFLYLTIKLLNNLQLNSNQIIEALSEVGSLELKKKMSTDQPPSEWFMKLVQQLGEKNIIEKFDLNKMQVMLVKIVKDFLIVQAELESEDRAIIEQAMTVITCILLNDKNLLNQNFQDQSFINLLNEGIFTQKNANVRLFFIHDILLICYQAQKELQFDEPLKIMLQLLIQQLPECSKPNGIRSSEQYFELLGELIGNSDQFKDLFDFPTLTLNIIHTLRMHQSQESLSKDQSDPIIIGLINLLTKIISLDISQELPGLIEVIFNDCLFNITSEHRDIKCKTKESREIAFTLLKVLCKQKKQLDTLISNCLLPLSQRIPLRSSWSHIPGHDMRQSTGYLGIRNLGCICYMIAMLQQFFTIPAFRYGLMMADDKQPPQIGIRPKDQIEQDENVFHQLQKMFAYLELSDRADYNPIEFCFSFKDFEGQPVDVGVQQDAQEFLNMILDRIETPLKTTPFKHLLDGIFGGKTCTQMTCSKCNFVKNKEETFLNVSLPMKNQKNLFECFEKFISGEVISDYKCDNCSQKVELTKRQYLSSLPNVLILHLQRIVFNLDSLMNEKINSRLEFPIELELNQYMLPGLENIDTHYKLAGVVVHIGAAEFGHYFSYINVDRQGNEKWLEFNDSKVKEFNVKNLESESFGGISNDSQSDDNAAAGWGWWKQSRENSQNAYMLVYEKVNKEKIKLEFESVEQKEQYAQNIEILQVGEEYFADYYAFKQYIPENLKQIVQNDNQQFQLERNLNDKEFFSFLQEVAEQTNSAQLMFMLIPYCFDLLARAYENRMLEPLVDQLKVLINAHPDQSFMFLRKFLFERPSITMEILLQCPESNTREMVGSLLALTFNTIINHFKLDLSDENIITQKDKSIPPTQEEMNGAIVSSLEALFDSIKNLVPKNWLRFNQYFNFWKYFMLGGEVQQQYMMKKKFITYFLDFTLDRQSPLNLYEKKNTMGNPNYPPNFSTVFEITCYLIIKFEKLSQDDLTLLYNQKLIERVLKNIASVKLVSVFLTKMCENNMLYSEIICTCLLKLFAASATSLDDLSSLLQISGELMKLKDTYQKVRREWLLGFPQLEQRPEQSKLKKDELPKFGTYGVNTLDDEVYKYPSPLQYQTTILDLIACNLGPHKKYDSACLLAIKLVLELLEDIDIRSYLISLPCVNYLYISWVNSFKQFLDYYVSETKRYFYQTFPREQLQNEVAQMLEKTEDYSSQWNYIIGNTHSREIEKYFFYYNMENQTYILVDQYDLDALEWKNQPKMEKIAALQINNYQVSICESKPTGKSNEVFPEKQVKNNIIFNYAIEDKSVLSNFFEHKQPIWNNWSQSNQAMPATQGAAPQFIEEVAPQQESVIVPGFQQREIIKSVNIINQSNKQIHFILSVIQDDNEQLNVFLPVSDTQKIVKASSVVNMVLLQKIDPTKSFNKLKYSLRCNILDKGSLESNLFVSHVTEEQLMLLNR